MWNVVLIKYSSGTICLEPSSSELRNLYVLRSHYINSLATGNAIWCLRT